jgi:hypothetical protein
MRRTARELDSAIQLAVDIARGKWSMSAFGIIADPEDA